MKKAKLFTLSFLICVLYIIFFHTYYIDLTYQNESLVDAPDSIVGPEKFGGSCISLFNMRACDPPFMVDIKNEDYLVKRDSKKLFQIILNDGDMKNIEYFCYDSLRKRKVVKEDLGRIACNDNDSKLFRNY